LAYITTLPGEWPGINTKAAFMSIGFHWLVFLPSAFLATERFFDVTGQLDYSFLALWSLMAGGTYHTRQFLVTMCVLIWSIRLGIFLYLRIQRKQKDGRFDEIKHHIPRFFNMWTIQGCWVYLTMVPVFCLNATETDVPFPQSSDYFGMVCFGIGFACEVIADNQKTAFAMNPDNEGKWISTGLWALSRHPNYFGEILLWIGIFLMSSTVFTGGQWLAIESPCFVAFLLIKVSGIPLLEARAENEWGHDPTYQAYKEATPELIPWPTSINMSHFMDSPTDLKQSLMGDAESGQQPMVET